MPQPTTSHAVANVSISSIITSVPGTGSTPLHRFDRSIAVEEVKQSVEKSRRNRVNSVESTPLPKRAGRIPAVRTEF
jgi:hypothetical protein